LLGVIIAVAVTACGGGNGGEAESADDVVSCFEDAELTEVEDGEVSDAEDIGALEEAAGEEADGFVSALDSEGRDVFVLGIIAVILGVVAKREIDATPNLTGSGLAIAGIAVGAIAFVLAIVILVTIGPTLFG
jgi:hypothetical protein